ncbi:NAD(P)/FAD-dependent oxidoreductase [Sediminibacterium sp.]|uniref:NAD(P)/FAD-dependent oxidoreductase n=1 Tax=Sediminibacterium sp. TaxID=1917865 RepID=UPI0027322C1A|nr:FAD-binding protein [Sediminibacterium sp.]MDP3567465.1 FAD-binding protein [Sediminibacterium sp.]
MQTKLQLKVSPQIAFNEQQLKDEVKQQLQLKEDSKLFVKVLKRSIDARSRSIEINLTVLAFVDEEFTEEKIAFNYLDVSSAKETCHIIGGGPAGLFAALRCLELGIKPIIIERGKNIKDRRRDLAIINKDQIVNPESNYCFGEGGAGTYSDGKLYTRSNKRGDIDKILKTLVYHGASDEILVDAHPHIGTNKLPQLIEKIRETILKFGGEVKFNTKLIDFKIKGDVITSIVTLNETGESETPIQKLILATGHSARDIYELLNKKNVLVEAKPFAIGIRVEHPQTLIDKIQYHCGNLEEVVAKREYLPAASYSLVHQVKGRGVYSFCMCPGGIIAPCATNQQEIVTNGWSPSKRNNPFANSGIVVGLELSDFEAFKDFGPLAGLEFQKQIEKSAWSFGGKTQTAPAQRLQDFVNGKFSSSLPDCSYQPGVKSVDLQQVLGKLIGPTLKEGLKAFGGKMRGYMTNEAIVVGVESRTSTPVRIPRDKELLCHPQLKNLFPCGEGAGYAGGIVSAAMDGERCAAMIMSN